GPQRGYLVLGIVQRGTRESLFRFRRRNFFPPAVLHSNQPHPHRCYPRLPETFAKRGFRGFCMLPSRIRRAVLLVSIASTAFLLSPVSAGEKRVTAADCSFLPNQDEFLNSQARVRD